MTATRRRRPRLALLAFAFAGACGAASLQEERSPALAAASATIENGLPYDGCSFPVEIDGVTYAPDAQSVDALRDTVAIGKTTVDVDYRLTGRTGRVECGWNTHQDLPEIEVVVRSR
jgi:hypothetical protein